VRTFDERELFLPTSQHQGEVLGCEGGDLHCRGVAKVLDSFNGRMIDGMNSDGSRSEGDEDTVVVVAASSSIAMKHRTPTARHRAVAVVWVASVVLSVVVVEAAAMRRVALRGSQMQESPEEGDEQGRGGGRRAIQESLFDSSSLSAAPPPSSSSSFDLVQGRTVSYAFTDRYQCHAGLDQPIPRMPLPDPIRNAPGFVDFFPQWRGRNSGSNTQSRPLKVVIVGDSIAIQLSQVVDEAIGTHERINLRNHLVGGRQRQECAHVSQSGGDGNVVVAGMRLRNLLRNSTRERSETPQSSEFWNPAVINELLQYEVDTPREPSLQQATNQKQPIGTFDAMVQRIPHGWISLQDITYDSLRENAMLAAEWFGIETLVLINLPLINNVVDYEGKEGYLTLLQKRQLIRNFAAAWKPPQGIRLQHVLVLELGDLVDDLLEWNAQIMGFNTSLPYREWMLGHTLRVNDETAPTKQRQRRRAATAAASRSTPSYYNHKVAHKCAVRVPDTATACPRNSITYDGMHLCMSTLGGRTVSGMACLIDCSLDALETEKGQDDFHPDSSAELRSCESRCNGQFMSTKPVPASMMMRQIS
jgi:hypothetical protein